MPEQIVISDKELQGFTPQGRADLIESISAYKSDLLKEVGRIEAGQNAGSGTPEITSRMVKDAELIFSRGSIYRRKRNGIKILKGAAVVSLFIAGAMVQREQLKDFTYLLVFLGVVIFAITTNILVNLRD